MKRCSKYAKEPTFGCAIYWNQLLCIPLRISHLLSNCYKKPKKRDYFDKLTTFSFILIYIK